MNSSLRVIAALLAALLLSAPALAAQDGGSFADVPEDSWAFESVHRARDCGLVSGVAENQFGMGQEVTRAQYATMLCRLMGWELVSPRQNSFTDNADPGAWYYSAIETAYAYGALLKLRATCEPNEPLPREEMTAMTVRALGYASLAGIAQNDCPFSDVTTNPGYIALAWRMGIVNGVSDSEFAPKAPCRREEATAVLLRVYDLLNAELERIDGEAPAGTIFAEPQTGAQKPVPVSPRASLEAVYSAALKAGAGGEIGLHTAPCAQVVTDGAAGPSAPLPEEEFTRLLEDPNTQTYRSARAHSSYLIHPEEDGSSTVVWYESEEDLAVKLALCRLLHIGTVYLAE